ncbi:general L-amino ABC transporter binding protein, partial [Candidatus Thiomargarita nelsonii]
MILTTPNTHTVAEDLRSKTLPTSVLELVKKKGFIQCGVNTGAAAFSSLNDKGEWTGFDVDFCRAVAAATLGDTNKVKYTPLTAKE